MGRVRITGSWKPLEDAMIDWMPILNRMCREKYGARKGPRMARDMFAMAITINRYYRRDIGMVEKSASLRFLAKHLGMSFETARLVTDELLNAGLIKPYKPRRSNRGGRPPKMYRLADPIPKPPEVNSPIED